MIGSGTADDRGVGRPRLPVQEPHAPMSPPRRSRRWLTRITFAAVVAAAASPFAAETHPSPQATVAADWDPASLQIVDDLVAKLGAAGKACEDVTRWSYALLAGDYQSKGLPAPTAAAACTGDGEENLAFEVFSDADTAARFIAAKRKLLCAAAARGGIAFPGFPYVDGGRWIVEPDEQTTAVGLARILGGTVKNAGCS